MSSLEILTLQQFDRAFSELRIQASFVARPQERLVLMGPSGSGKTSVFRFIAGLLEPGEASGRVLLGSRDLSNLPPEERELGVVFQEAHVFPNLSVLENAAFGLRVRGVGTAERRTRALAWLERCGLSRLADSPAIQLSGGEKQRLALVRTMMWGPQALLLDEPFSALDPALRAEMGEWLVRLHQENPIPLVLVTHDSEEAARIGTRVLSVQITPGVHCWKG